MKGSNYVRQEAGLLCSLEFVRYARWDFSKNSKSDIHEILHRFSASEPDVTFNFRDRQGQSSRSKSCKSSAVVWDLFTKFDNHQLLLPEIISA